MEAIPMGLPSFARGLGWMNEPVKNDSGIS
jgi:hypothetical protein